MFDAVINTLADVGYRSLLLGATVSFVLVWVIRQRSSERGRLKLPPGPIAIPWPLHYLTRLVAMWQNPLILLGNLSKQYGDMVYISQGDRHFLFLSNPEIVKDILVKHADVTAGREGLWELEAVTNYTGGIIFSEGGSWLDHRRFGLAALRNFGMGKKSLENRINEESVLLRDALTENVGSPLDMFFVLNNAVSNIICAITFGHRFEYSDPKFKDMIEGINYFVSEDPGVFGNLPPFIMNARRRNLIAVRDHLMGEVKEHEETFDPNDVRDVIDMYLKEIQRAREAGEKTELGSEKAWAMVFDFFLAGTETTSTTLMWALLFVTGHPDIQEKIVAEIDAVIGHDKVPSFEDRKLMPYTEATLTEVLRFRPIAPNGIPHRATSDLKVRGYDIPEGTLIGINILYIHHDPKIWGDPEVFRPDRFLTEDGKGVIKHDAYMPFGVGRRVCLGEQLAKMEMFLFFTNILQRFKTTFPPGANADYSFGHRVTTLSPKPYKIVLEER